LSDEPTALDIHRFAIYSHIPSFFENGRSLTYEDFVRFFSKVHPDVYHGSDHPIIKEIFEWLMEIGVFYKIGGRYSSKVIIFSRGQYNNVGIGGEFSKQFNTVKDATSEDFAEQWLQETLRNSLNDITYSEQDILEDFETNDVWAPLPIDRDSVEYQETVAAIEDAISEVEGNNGYSSEQPEERDAIVTTLKSGSEAFKNGSPTKKFIKTTLVDGFKYLIKRFTDSAIGIAAKKALEHLLPFVGLS
jgi:hypothetical protein